MWNVWSHKSLERIIANFEYFLKNLQRSFDYFALFSDSVAAWRWAWASNLPIISVPVRQNSGYIRLWSGFSTSIWLMDCSSIGSNTAHCDSYIRCFYHHYSLHDSSKIESSTKQRHISAHGHYNRFDCWWKPSSVTQYREIVICNCVDWRLFHDFNLYGQSIGLYLQHLESENWYVWYVGKYRYRRTNLYKSNFTNACHEYSSSVKVEFSKLMDLVSIKMG